MNETWNELIDDKATEIFKSALHLIQAGELLSPAPITGKFVSEEKAYDVAKGMSLVIREEKPVFDYSYLYIFVNLKTKSIEYIPEYKLGNSSKYDKMFVGQEVNFSLPRIFVGKLEICWDWEDFVDGTVYSFKLNSPRQEEEHTAWNKKEVEKFSECLLLALEDYFTELLVPSCDKFYGDNNSYLTYLGFHIDNHLSLISDEDILDWLILIDEHDLIADVVDLLSTFINRFDKCNVDDKTRLADFVYELKCLESAWKLSLTSALNLDKVFKQLTVSE